MVKFKRIKFVFLLDIYIKKLTQCSGNRLHKTIVTKGVGQFIDNQFIDNQFIDSRFIDSRFIDSRFIDTTVLSTASLSTDRFIDSRFIDRPFYRQPVYRQAVLSTPSLSTLPFDRHDRLIDKFILSTILFYFSIGKNNFLKLCI